MLPIDAGRAGDAVAVPQQFERRMVVEDGHPRRAHPAAHEVHVIGAAQVGEVGLPVIAGRKLVAPLGQPVQPVPGHIQRAMRDPRVGEAAGAGKPLIDRIAAPVARRDEPRAGIGWRGRAAGAEISLVDDDHPRAGLRRRERRPSRRRSAADDEHIGRDFRDCPGRAFAQAISS